VYFNDLLPLKCCLLAAWGRALLPWFSSKLTMSIGYKHGAPSRCGGDMVWDPSEGR